MSSWLATPSADSPRFGRDVTLSAPKSVSLMAMVSDDERAIRAHDKAVGKTLD